MTITHDRPAPGIPAGSPRRSSALDLGPYPGAASSARLHTRAILAEWGLDELSADSETVVTELVTNAIEAHQREHRDAPVRLTLLAGLRTALIVVTDSSSRPPVRNDPGPDLESGRGLLIVEALAAQWGWKRTPDGGKAVRAVVRASPSGAGMGQPR